LPLTRHPRESGHRGSGHRGSGRRGNLLVRGISSTARFRKREPVPLIRRLLALAAALVIGLAGWALTAPLLIHLVGFFDKPDSPGDPEGLGYIFYSVGAMILAVPLWVWLAYRAYRLIKHWRPSD
jgi:hypothetical protein